MLQAFLGHRKSQHGGIDAPALELLQQGFGLFLDQQQFDLREALLQRPDHVRQQVRGQCGEKAEAKAAGFWVVGEPGDFAHLLDFGDDPARALGDARAGLGQHDLPRRTFHKHHAEFVFQLSDLRGQRGLADMAGLGGVAKMPVVGEGQQVAQVT